MRGNGFVLIASLVASSAPGAAQAPPPVTPGAQVRVWAPAQGWHKRTAVVSRLAADTLYLVTRAVEVRRGRSVAVEQETALPVAGIQRIEAQSGRHSNVAGGVKTGALIGAGVGLAIGIGAYASSDANDFVSYGPEAIPLGALGGAMWGTLIGLVIGAFTTTADWNEVQLMPSPVPVVSRVYLRPHGERLLVGLTLRL